MTVTATEADRLRLVIARLARRLRQSASAGLSPTYAAALATISKHGPITPSQLAEHERIQRPTATRVIARLEDEGLVARTKDPTDGRSCTIALTPEGEALMAQSRSEKTAYLEQGISRLNPDEQATLRAALPLLERLLADGS